MKQKLLTIKSLLVAALLGVGVGNAWATDYTETYNFTDGSIADVTFSPSDLSFATADASTVYLPSNCAALKERFAFDNGNDAWGNPAWSINKKSGGLRRLSSAGHISVLDLQAGDKITFTLNGSYTPTLTVKSSNLSVAAETVIVSGTEYTVTASGQLDLTYATPSNSYTTIEKVTIVSQKQSVTRPTISAVLGFDGATITVAPGSVRGDATGTVVTKYAFETIEADKTSGTAYTDAVKTTQSGTVYAYSYVDAEDGLASDVVSKNYVIPEFVKTKVIDFTTLGHEGLSSGNNWSTKVYGTETSNVSYPTWVLTNEFIPELSFGSNYQIVSNSNYFGVRGGNASSITIDDLASDQIAKLVAQPANSENDVLQYGANGKTMSVPGWRIASKLEYYSPATTTITLNVGDAGLATYMGSYTINLTGDTKIAAYKATVSGSTVTLTKVTTVPAGEAVLLRSLDGGAAETTVPVAVYGAWAAADNELVGAYKAITVNQVDGDYTNFVLSKEGDVVGFFKAKTSGDGGTTVGAGKAYLPVLTAGLSEARRVSVVFDDETTAIETIQTSKTTADGYYDLQGRRVTQPTKGLYIVNGKKVVIK